MKKDLVEQDIVLNLLRFVADTMVFHRHDKQI